MEDRMLEDFLRERYEFGFFKTCLQRMIYYSRLENEISFIKEFKEAEKYFGSFINALSRLDGKIAEDFEINLRSLSGIKDVKLFGDIVECNLLPLVDRYFMHLGAVNVDADDEFLLESTSSGFLTVKNKKKKLYYHSNANPLNEAIIYMDKFYKPQYSEYTVFGCGLGYYIYALNLVSDGSVKIYVYDSAEMVDWAYKYGLLSFIPEENIEVHTEDPILEFLQKASEDGMGILMDKTAINCLNDVDRNAINSINVEINTAKAFGNHFEINFYRNYENCQNELNSEILSAMTGEICVVAAGPSLNERMEEVKRMSEKRTVIAVGTVLRKLLNEGIKPDYFVISDPQERTYAQIEGLEDCGVPMIANVTANWRFLKNYKGPKYIVFGNVCDDSDILAIVNDKETSSYALGGTVSHSALYIATKAKPSKILMYGIDLAYPGGVSHATGTMDYKAVNTEGKIKAISVGGGITYTDEVFMSYRDGIEALIKQNPDIRFVNRSIGGVRIKGTTEEL
ncbi:MAG: DUF115 domain-containing protein [Acetatifactor sp.]|nr:DUF115 domain-containing protein [Acetatifactor sp.]